MKVKTIAGEVYVVSSAGGCTVTATTDDGQEITLCTVPAGGQKAFAAIGGDVEVSDPGAVVQHLEAANVPLGMEGACSASQVIDMVQTALYDFTEASLSTEVGTANLTAHLVTLAPVRVPTGRLKSLAMQCRSNSPQYLAGPIYLALYERSADGAGWEKAGVSTAAVQQVVGTSSTWSFRDVWLHGRELRIQPISSADDSFVESGSVTLGLIGVASSDGSKCDTLAYIPQLTFNYDRQMDRYVPMSYGKDAIDFIIANKDALQALING